MDPPPSLLDPSQEKREESRADGQAPQVRGFNQPDGYPQLPDLVGDTVLFTLFVSDIYDEVGETRSDYTIAEAYDAALVELKGWRTGFPGLGTVEAYRKKRKEKDRKALLDKWGGRIRERRSRQ